LELGTNAGLVRDPSSLLSDQTKGPSVTYSHIRTVDPKYDYFRRPSNYNKNM
jgi:hypothetical protein